MTKKINEAAARRRGRPEQVAGANRDAPVHLSVPAFVKTWLEAEAGAAGEPVSPYVAGLAQTTDLAAARAERAWSRPAQVTVRFSQSEYNRLRLLALDLGYLHAGEAEVGPLLYERLLLPRFLAAHAVDYVPELPSLTESELAALRRLAQAPGSRLDGELRTIGPLLLKKGLVRRESCRQPGETGYPRYCYWLLPDGEQLLAQHP